MHVNQRNEFCVQKRHTKKNIGNKPTYRTTAGCA
uniref:Uncharacterized protein n=1 Tax=Arundo donax TaxID=35708 RepID=A0A0A8YC23_ARUDO